MAGIWVPIRLVNGERWGNLAALSFRYELCAEDYGIQQNTPSLVSTGLGCSR
jgi:hypothetical protein